MRGCRNTLDRQRGVAVIIALLLTTLATTIVASLFWQQQVQVRSIENQRLHLQQQWILRGALDWASLILREDAKYSRVDNLDEPWAVPLAETRLDQYVESGRADTSMPDATLSGSIEDAQARYNLTNLCPDGIINPAEVAAFARLLSNAKLNPALAAAAAGAMEAAQKKSKATPADHDSLSGSQPINLTQLDDLLTMPDFSPRMLDTLKDFVTVLPRATPVNVNTAPPEILAARIEDLSPSDAIALVAKRSTASFRDLDDFAHRLSGKSFSASPSEISVASDYFLVNGKARMNRAELKIQALVERNGANTRLVWIRES